MILLAPNFLQVHVNVESSHWKVNCCIRQMPASSSNPPQAAGSCEEMQSKHTDKANTYIAANDFG